MPVAETTNIIYTKRPQIIGLLQKVMHRKSMLTITPPGANQFFNSVILAIDDKNSLIRFDETMPAHGHRLLQKTMRFRARLTIRGIETYFDCHILHIGEESGIPYYEVALPDKIVQRQRRSGYRIRIGLNKGITVSLTEKEAAPPLHLHMFDLSMVGLCATTNQALPSHIKRGKVIAECLFQIHDNDEIRCAMEVRFTDTHSRINSNLIGGKFIGLSIIEHRKINKFITQLERENIRTTSNAA